MRTFEHRDHCKFESKELYAAALDYARAKGVSIYKLCGIESFYEYPCIAFVRGELCGSKRIGGDREITIAQFFEYCDNWEKCKPVELQLNDEYKAVVNKEDKTVKVGCQYFSFDKINELHKLINQ